jgi:UDP-N-acetylmuramate dehydrogenase
MALPSTLARPVLLRTLTTLGVGGPAELWEVANETELREVTMEPYRVIGAGSNLLVADTGLSERVLKLGQAYNSLADFPHRLEPDGAIWLGAATPLPGLVRRAAEAGLSGLEGLLGIPAVLGGALAMNAGTRYGELSDTLQEAELLVNGRLERVPADALGLRYRHASLPEGAIVTRMRLRLVHSSAERVRETMQRVDAARKGQPKIKSAGCAFKNPPGDSAGRLIDAVGLKGLRVGGAMVSLEHGNFIVNAGGATAADVIALLKVIRSRITPELEVEWRLWGFGTDPFGEES